LERGYSRSEYIVLNDGYFFARIWADTEEEAINKFMAGDYKKGGAA